MKGAIIPKLPIDSFCWQRYRLGRKVWRELGVACRYWDMIDQADVLRKYAVGYRPGLELGCRPKENEIAVMFIVDDEFCWTHLRKKEFEDVFTK